MTPSLTIAVLTFRRNHYLDELLPALVEQARAATAAHTATRVLVVDNDPQMGARELVGTWAGRAAEQGVEVVYSHEPVPGVVAGRNRALEESGAFDLLAFIDDDELPAPRWLESLLATRAATGAQGVTGPTPSRFETDPSAWVRASGAFDEAVRPDRAVVPSAGAGNLLLDLGFVRGTGLRFDPRYGLTGGEDSLFTRQLTRAGGVIRFSAGASVTLRVSAQRATRRWVLTRSYRAGSSWARVRIDTHEGFRAALRARYVLKGAAKAALAALAAAGAGVVGRTASRARHEVDAAGGAGMVAGALGARVEEYARSGRGDRS